MKGIPIEIVDVSIELRDFRNVSRGCEGDSGGYSGDFKGSLLQHFPLRTKKKEKTLNE